MTDERAAPEAWFEVWDRDSGNIVGSWTTLDEARETAKQDPEWAVFLCTETSMELVPDD